MEENDSTQIDKLKIIILTVAIIVIAVMGLILVVNSISEIRADQTTNTINKRDPDDPLFMNTTGVATKIMKTVQIVSLCGSIILVLSTSIVYLKRKIRINKEITDEKEKDEKLKNALSNFKIYGFVSALWFVASLLISQIYR